MKYGNHTDAQHETTSYLCETLSCYKWFILIYINALNKPKHQSLFFVACDGGVVVTIIEYCVYATRQRREFKVLLTEAAEKYMRLCILHINVSIYKCIPPCSLYAQRKTADRGKNCDKKIELCFFSLLCVSRLLTHSPTTTFIAPRSLRFPCNPCNDSL